MPPLLSTSWLKLFFFFALRPARNLSKRRKLSALLIKQQRGAWQWFKGARLPDPTMINSGSYTDAYTHSATHPVWVQDVPSIAVGRATLHEHRRSL